MILTTTDNIPGKNWEPLGLVKGEIVQSKHFGKDFLAGFRNLVGGEITEYTEMISEARQYATERMLQDAERLQADAILGIRYTSSSVMQGASEILVYGTAVRFV